jgi:hypothetical protein
MTIGYTRCPYCDKEVEIDWDGREQGVIFTQVCTKCDETFEVYYELSIDFFASKIKEKK